VVVEQEFLEHPRLTDLGFGAGFALWGFRSCARSQERCCVIVRGFQRTFGPDAPLAVGGLLALARISGETAPLLFTAFGNQYWNNNIFQPMASVPVDRKSVV